MMNKFVLNVSGFECYTPVWFEKDCTKEDFETAVRECIHDSLPEIIEKDEYIAGHDLLDVVQVMLENKGFKIIQPVLEISLYGECFYRDISDKPDSISPSDWLKILEHNKRIHDKTYNE